MQIEVVFAGFGGQGVLLIGKLLALAGMDEGKHVAWIPSYGPEMRGGTANCTVVVSDMPIGSPIIVNPQCGAVLNRPSLDKFQTLIKPNGCLIINSSLIKVDSDRTDLNILKIPANDIALKAGNAKATNMAILGAFVGMTKIVGFDTVTNVMKSEFGKKKPKLLDVNMVVFEEGFNLA